MAPRPETGRYGRCAALLLSLITATGALTGCDLLDAALDRGCEDSKSRIEEAESYSILGSHPEGAIVPKGFEDIDSGCWADSGDAWVYANQIYVFPGDRGDKTDVTEYYREAAKRDGWKLFGAYDPAGSGNRAKPGEPADLCFTLGKEDKSTILNVAFGSGDELTLSEERKPGTEFSSGHGYRVTIDSTADGSPNGCPD
ncbi:hypothetical protein [Streptomyces paludis]|uniref:DUF3558 domain-containing protein n=1 Tax=Streptomyces paludis TaxID=2282738 RepID=A0A345HLC2_9ACTN|nr:hypothetical protein [Streptomyces paludis]AXG77496.1 hypothetical protein DVK44_07075 [Streptomyces paludis]